MDQTVVEALSDRRAELEAMKGRAQYLSQTTALSQIHLELWPKIIYPMPALIPILTPEAWWPPETTQR